MAKLILQNEHTGHHIFCAGSKHRKEGTMAMLSAPAITPFEHFMLNAKEEGWEWNSYHGHWHCPQCVQEKSCRGIEASVSN
jgi:hypothetical protein